MVVEKRFYNRYARVPAAEGREREKRNFLL